MKHIAKILAVGAVLAASAPLALAGSIYGQISMSGTDSYTSGPTYDITFTNPASVGGAVTGTIGTYFTDGNAVTMTNFSYSSGFSPLTVFSTTEGGETLSYYLSSESYALNGAGDLTITGTGWFHETGTTNYMPTFANFDLTSQGGGTGKEAVTFSNTSVALTPEPSSLILMGTGLLSSAAMMIRSRRRAV